jgi:hypothetical protein
MEKFREIGPYDVVKDSPYGDVVHERGGKSHPLCPLHRIAEETSRPHDERKER